jgi:hypothetical protein
MQQIGRYEILLELGRGAMGAVYQARDPQIDRTVAIKVILTQGLSPRDLENYKQRFYREARAAGKMAHPGIVTIHDIAEDESGHPYLVMEFVEGSTLEDIVETHLGRGEQMPLDKALDIAIQVANALDYAHKRGVVHRDVKPANVLVTPEGIAKIADFGIAKISGVSLTQTGSFLGTPAFMSPEQFSGGAIEARSDLFSLGAMLYWVFTGQQPFGGDTLTTVSFRIVFTYPIPATTANPHLPPDLQTVLMRCLAKNPAERYASCRDLAEDLKAIKLGKPIQATPLPLQEATIVNAPALVAVPMAAGMGGTVAVPPGASVTGTVAETPQVSPTAATTRMERKANAAEAPRRRGLLGALRTRPVVSSTLALLLLTLAAGGMWLWTQMNRAAQRSGSQPVAEVHSASQVAELAPAPALPPPSAQPAEEAAPPVASSQVQRGRGASRGRKSAPPAGPTATLVIECLHNFRDGTLEVLMDGQPLATLALRGEVRDLKVMTVASGTVRRTLTVPAGQHVFTVRARANRGEYRGEEEIGGSFSEDATRIMLVEFGRGSGLGVIDRKLTLAWR